MHRQPQDNFILYCSWDTALKPISLNYGTKQQSFEETEDRDML